MKILPVLLSWFIASSLLAADPPAEEIKQFLADGQAAFVKGDYVAAKGAFETVYHLDPRNLTAINYLQKIKSLEKTAPRVVDQEKQLQGVIVPKVQLKDATLGAVFDYLRSTAERLTDGKVSVNFVLKVPDDVIKTQTITLSMSNVPYTEVVKYVAELADLNVQYQKYAVLVTPRPAPTPPAVAGPATEPK